MELVEDGREIRILSLSLILRALSSSMVKARMSSPILLDSSRFFYIYICFKVALNALFYSMVWLKEKKRERDHIFFSFI